MEFFTTKFNVPKSKEECLKSNQVIENLDSWAKKLEVFGIIICIIILIAGIFLSFQAEQASRELINAANKSDRYFTKEIKFDTSTFISSITSYIFYAFITYCSFHAVALIISAISKITYNTMVTAKAALLQIPEKNNSTNPDQTLKYDKKYKLRICKNCGAESYNKLDFCLNCGERFDGSE